MADPSSNAYDLLTQMLRNWGLESLAPEVLRLLQEGNSQEQVSVLIQDTEPYKRRFAGNDARRRAGLSALTPAEYLSAEASYRQILESAGMPVGFYDDPSDFASWIGNDVSPNEINSRVGLATEAANRLDDGTKRAFREFYGVAENDLAAYFLDRDRALPLVQKQARAARIGAESFRQNTGIDRGLAERAASGSLVSDSAIEEAVITAADMGREVGRIGSLYGDRFGVDDAVHEIFLGDADATATRKKLVNREKAEFGGSSGISKSSLSKSSGSY